MQNEKRNMKTLYLMGIGEDGSWRFSDGDKNETSIISTISEEDGGRQHIHLFINSEIENSVSFPTDCPCTVKGFLYYDVLEFRKNIDAKASDWGYCISYDVPSWLLDAEDETDAKTLYLTQLAEEHTNLVFSDKEKESFLYTGFSSTPGIQYIIYRVCDKTIGNFKFGLEPTEDWDCFADRVYSSAQFRVNLESVARKLKIKLVYDIAPWERVFDPDFLEA